jgi:hypothetical protein
LRQSEKEITLVLTPVAATKQKPSTAILSVFDPSIVPGRDHLGADLLRSGKKLIKLQMIVAETARNRRSS